jgi:hypothetical protein
MPPPTLANRTSKLLTGDRFLRPKGLLHTRKLNSSGAAKGGSSSTILLYFYVNTHAHAQLSGVEAPSHGVQHTVNTDRRDGWCFQWLSGANFIFHTKRQFFFFTAKPITGPSPSQWPKKRKFPFPIRSKRLVSEQRGYKYSLTRNLRLRYSRPDPTYLHCDHAYTAPWLRIEQ